MLRLLIIPLLLLLGQPVSPENPGTENLRYEVRYLYGALNARVATASFDLAPDVWEGKDVYRSDIHVRVKPIFRLFLKADYVVEGRFSRPGMALMYYRSPSDRGEAWCRYTEGDKGVYYWRQYDKMPEPEIYVYPNDGKTFELMSMLYFARVYPFREGVPCEVKVILGGKLFPAVITWESTDTERYPGHTAQVLHLVFPERGLMENGSGNEATVWRDADGSQPVLGLEVNLGKKGTMVCNILEDK